MPVKAKSRQNAKSIENCRCQMPLRVASKNTLATHGFNKGDICVLVFNAVKSVHTLFNMTSQRTYDISEVKKLVRFVELENHIVEWAHDADI